MHPSSSHKKSKRTSSTGRQRLVLLSLEIVLRYIALNNEAFWRSR